MNGTQGFQHDYSQDVADCGRVISLTSLSAKGTYQRESGRTSTNGAYFSGNRLARRGFAIVDDAPIREWSSPGGWTIFDAESE